MLRLQEIVERLRAPGGCPWDREQTHESLRASLLEESHEVIGAIVGGDDENLKEELGDLLLLVMMHSRIAEERGAFGFAEVEEGICEKMVRRHPHVFGKTEVADTAAVLRQWEEIKKQERGERGGEKRSAVEGISRGLPSLMRAQEVQKRARKVGFDWPDGEGVEGPLRKLEEEVGELREAVREGGVREIEEEMGDLLFSVVNVARKLGVDAEVVLAGAVEKFLRRFRKVEEKVWARGEGLEGKGLEELDEEWERVKREERGC